MRTDKTTSAGMAREENPKFLAPAKSAGERERLKSSCSAGRGASRGVHEAANGGDSRLYDFVLSLLVARTLSVPVADIAIGETRFIDLLLRNTNPETGWTRKDIQQAIDDLIAVDAIGWCPLTPVKPAKKARGRMIWAHVYELGEVRQ